MAGAIFGVYHHRSQRAAASSTAALAVVGSIVASTTHRRPGTPRTAVAKAATTTSSLHLVGDQRAPLAGWSIASTHSTTPCPFARLAIAPLASSICNGHFPIWRCSRLPAAASPGGRCRRLSCVSCLPRRRLTEPAPRRVHEGRLGPLRTRAAAARARNQRPEALCSLSLRALARP